MNTVKDCLLIKDHFPDVSIKVFYMDIRAFGKGFEDLFQRSKEAGTQYIRGIPGEIEEDPATKSLRLYVENTHRRQDRVSRGRHGHPVGRGHSPSRQRQDQQLLTLQRSQDGFFLEAHPKLKPVDAATQGVFFAGCAESPKDIKDSVTQAGAAAARANRLMMQGKVKVEAITSTVIPELCRSCGICVQGLPVPRHLVRHQGKEARGRGRGRVRGLRHVQR